MGGSAVVFTDHQSIADPDSRATCGSATGVMPRAPNRPSELAVQVEVDHPVFPPRRDRVFCDVLVCNL